MTETSGRTTRVKAHPAAPPLVRKAMGSLSRIAPGLAARIAADLFMRPLRPRPRPRERQWLQDARPVGLPTRHGELAGWSWGEGAPVVFLHGWNGRASQMGLLARAAADAGLRAIAFDGPAHGRSPGRRTNLINYSAALVDVCSGLPDLRGVVGHSFGALALSYRWAELPPLERLVMISPPAEVRLYSRMFTQAVGASEEVHERMLDIYRRRFDVTWDDLTVENLAPELTAPLLIIHDRTDRQAPFDHGERTRASWPNARLHETDGLGHNRILRDASVAREIAGFLTTTAT